MLNSFDINKNFWDENPEMGILFKDFKNKDKKSKSKKSSTIMWAIALAYHNDSKFSNAPLENRKELIAEDFLIPKGYTKFEWNDYDDIINRFLEFCTSKPQKILDRWESNLKDRQNFIDEIPYSLDIDPKLLELKEKMMKDTHNMWKQYQTCLKDVASEKSKNSTKGNIQKSLGEQGMFNN